MPSPVAGQELGQRAGTERRAELQAAVSQFKADAPDSFAANLVFGANTQPEGALPAGGGGLSVVHGDGQVVDSYGAIRVFERLCRLCIPLCCGPMVLDDEGFASWRGLAGYGGGTPRVGCRTVAVSTGAVHRLLDGYTAASKTGNGPVDVISARANMYSPSLDSRNPVMEGAPPLQQGLEPRSAPGTLGRTRSACCASRVPGAFPPGVRVKPRSSEKVRAARSRFFRAISTWSRGRVVLTLLTVLPPAPESS